MPVRDQQGNMVLKVEDKLRCWKEQFERVLNQDDPETEAIIIPSSELLDIDTDRRSQESNKGVKRWEIPRYRPDICRDAEGG